MNIAYFSPLPNQRTGIANYSNHLVSELSRFAQVELFHDGAQYFPGLKVNNYLDQPSSLGRLHEFDAVIFNFGNNPEFHLTMWHVFQMKPGTVILHDAVLYYLMAGRGKGGIIRENLGKKPTTIDRLRRTLEIVENTDRPGWLMGHSQPHKFPCLESIILKAKGIIVHSHSACELVRKAGFSGTIEIIPMPVYREELEAVSHCIAKRAETRRRLGLKKNDILLGCFGFQNRVKRNSVLVKAAERLNKKSNLKLLFAGIGELPVEQINNSPIASDIICPGYLSDKEFREHLAASDIVVNLRYPSMGETSATLLLAMLHSKPCIVTADSWFAELPDDSVLKINHGRRELIELVNAIERLIAIPSKRRGFGQNARNYVLKFHHPEKVGPNFLKVLERGRGNQNYHGKSNFIDSHKNSAVSNYFSKRTKELIAFRDTKSSNGSHCLERNRKSHDLSLEVFSLHVPKCGGTSFKSSLKEIYGSSFVSHYPPIRTQGKESLDDLNGKKCVHGHLVLDRYKDLLKGVVLLTWLRCPVERTMSFYQHTINAPDENDSFQMDVVRAQYTFDMFIEHEINHNQLFDWIGDRNPEDFQFVGFIDSIKVSMQKCAAVLHWPYVPSLPWLNKKTKHLSVSNAQRDYINDKNKEELLWIRKAKKIYL